MCSHENMHERGRVHSWPVQSAVRVDFENDRTLQLGRGAHQRRATRQTHDGNTSSQVAIYFIYFIFISSFVHFVSLSSIIIKTDLFVLFVMFCCCLKQKN